LTAIRLPAWLNAGSVSYSAENDRLTQAADWFPGGATKLDVRSGVVPGQGTSGMVTGALNVTAQGTPNMSVQVFAGQAVIQGTVTQTQGAYVCTSDSTQTLAIAAANATNPRIDLVVVTVEDAQYSGAANDALLQVITGTPAASPAAPALPSNSIALAQVLVPASATSIVSGNITDQRTWTVSRGGILPCLSTARPASPYGGMSIYETDTSISRIWDATLAAWVQIGDAAPWTAYTPTWGGVTLGNGSSAGHYKLLGYKTVAICVQITFGSTTNVTGNINFTLPAGMSSAALTPNQLGLIRGFNNTLGGRFLGDFEFAGGNASLALFGPNGAATSIQAQMNATKPGAWSTADVIMGEGIVALA
jgi:hypothetical protein